MAIDVNVPSTVVEVVDSDGQVVEVTVLGSAGGGGGGGGVTAHNNLTGRDAADSHPVSAITGLPDTLTELDVRAPIFLSVRIPVAVADLGGSITGDVLTAAALDGVPAGGVVLLQEQADGDDDGLWESNGDGTFDRSTALTAWVAASTGRLVVVGYDVEFMDSSVWQVAASGLQRVRPVDVPDLGDLTTDVTDLTNRLNRYYPTTPFVPHLHVSKYVTPDPDFPLDGTATHVGGQAIQSGQNLTILDNSSGNGGVWTMSLTGPATRATGFGSMVSEDIGNYDHVSYTGTRWAYFQLFRLYGDSTIRGLAPGGGGTGITGGEGVSKSYRADLIATSVDGDQYVVRCSDGTQTVVYAATDLATAGTLCILVLSTMTLHTIADGAVVQVEDFVTAEGRWTSRGVGGIAGPTGATSVVIAAGGAYSFLTGVVGLASGDLVGSFPAPSIAPLAVGTSKIDNGAVTVPKIGATGTASSSTYLRGDGTWATVSGGSGDVVGPASSVDGRAVLYDGTTGKLIKQASAAPVLEGDARLSDARTPATHKASHATGGTDALSPSDIGAVATTRTVGAGTGLTGGGDLSADRTLSVSFGTTSGTAAQGDDVRLSDARAPQWRRLTFSNADYNLGSAPSPAVARSVVLQQTGTLSAPRTVTLPTAAATGAGAEIIINAGAGASATNTVTISRAGSDTINGSASSISISIAWGQRRLVSDGVSAWVMDDGLMRRSANLSDLASASTARSNLGLATVASSGSASDLTTGTLGSARLPDLQPIYGTGVDGDSTISGTTTLTADTYYNNLTVTGTLNTANFRVFVSGTLSGNGTIACDGSTSIAVSGGAGVSAAVFAASGTGTNGSSGVAGQAGAVANRLGGAGGAGGNGTPNAGGSAQTGTVPVAANGGSTLYQDIGSFSRGVGAGAGAGTRVAGGVAGSGGGGDGTNAGGGGGGGGGCLFLAARAVTFTRTIRANGGNGATRSTGNVGGGGGGGGGVVVVVTGSSSQTFSTSVAGGTAGSGVGTGTAGSNGSAGTAVVYLGVK